MPSRQHRRVVAKAANYTVNPAMDRPGTVFTNRGATAPVTFTLPRPGAGVMGWWFRFKGVANFNLIVAGHAADTILALNDLTATSVALSTASQIIGGEMEAFCDGTIWMVSGVTVGHAYTVV